MQLRDGTIDDLPFLERMLFEAFFWNPSAPRPAFSEFRPPPEFRRLLDGWGGAGDRAILAEEDGMRIGAGWFRRWTAQDHSYGFVRDDVPELGLAVDPHHRSQGIGTLLLEALIAAAHEAHLPALSLSVSPENPARRLYERRGFRKVGESGTSWTYLLSLDGPRD